MWNRIRQLAAALAVGGLLLAHAPTATAGSLANADREGDTPILLDAIIMRPLIGIPVTCLGMVAFAVTSPLMAITRPTDMGKSFRLLVVAPARYTFVDPIGVHPPRR